MCQPSDAKADRFPALSAAERLFIWGFRSTARQGKPHGPTAAHIREVYGYFRVGDAVPTLESLIEIFARTAHTAIELHCPACPRMSPSEHDVMRAVAATQKARLDAARNLFECWLPPTAADWALGPVRSLTTVFSIAGLILPDREVQSLGNDVTQIMRTEPFGSPTLH